MTVLQDHLDEITANTRNLVQPERMAVSERAVQELFTSGIERPHPPRRRHRPRIHPQRCLGPPRPVSRSSGARAARPQFLPRPLVPLLRHRARGLARPLPQPPRGRRAACRHQPANRPPERLHGRPARLAVSRPHRSRLRPCRAVWPRLHHPSISPRLLPLDPGQHPLRERRSDLAPGPSGHLRPRPRPAASSMPRPTPTSASAPSRKRSSPLLWQPVGWLNPLKSVVRSSTRRPVIPDSRKSARKSILMTKSTSY